ncbi:hypothetical protein ACGFIF_17365 [Kribbella sp. NPDC049174]|uniref:hypothetical protein n=1 Tax=Kribbella sp. NPDC049174 TaxID=3364112 RepID=UPI003723BBEE
MAGRAQVAGPAGGSAWQELGAAAGLATLAPIAAAVAATTQPTDGYRAGYLAAAAVVLLATVLALRTPPSTGRATPEPADVATEC